MIFQKFIFLAGCFGLLSEIAHGSYPLQKKLDTSVNNKQQFEEWTKGLVTTLSVMGKDVKELDDWTCGDQKMFIGGQWELPSQRKTLNDLYDKEKYAVVLDRKLLDIKNFLEIYANDLKRLGVMSINVWTEQYSKASRLMSCTTQIIKTLNQEITKRRGGNDYKQFNQAFCK